MVLRKLTQVLTHPLKWSLSNAAHDVRAVQSDMIGERVSEREELEERTSLSGGPIETSAFLSRRTDGIYLFLTVTEHLTGGTSSRTYPIGPRGITGLVDILSRSPDRLFPQPAGNPEDAGLWGRFWRWVKEPLEGDVLQNFGCIDEVSLRNSPGVTEWRWEQSVEVLSTRKRSEDLLVLKIRYRSRGGSSGVVFVPLGETGRARLHAFLKRPSQEAASNRQA